MPILELININAVKNVLNCEESLNYICMSLAGESQLKNILILELIDME